MENGTIINQYKIISAIGKGGMGEVFLATDTRLARQVALKLLPAEFTQDAERVRRFMQEAKAASALNHPNIISVYDIGESEAGRFIVMELVAGRTLREIIATDNSLETFLPLSTQMAKALGAAHAAGITHRDLKPDNIMVRNDGYVKVLDFGLARLLTTNSGNSEAATLAQQTTPGTVMGTVAYMSPEQARGESVSPASDIFALGIVLYELATGRHPFQAETLVGYLHAITLQEPAPPQQWQPKLPAALNALILRMLSKDASQRPTANEVAQTLVEAEHRSHSTDNDPIEAQTLIQPQTTAAAPEVLATAAASAQPTSPDHPKRKQWWLAAGLSVLLAVGGFFGYKWLSPKQIESIAVMPFVNDSKNEDVEYLSDGMTETLISSLSNLPNLSVKARSTVFYYKGKETSPQKIGEELKVQAVLLGRVSQRGNDLKLSLELVNTETQDVIWSETYNRKQSDLVSLQTDIARDVSSKLKSKLSSAETASVEKIYTSNAEAYQLYLQGRFYWNKRTKTDLDKAVEYFKQAVAKDSNYALAYAGLADTYALLPDWADARPKDVMPQARQAAQTALELDPNLAEAHASLALVKFYYEYDWAGAEQSFKRAIELNPKYPTVRQWYGSFLLYSGRLDEGGREMSKAAELDPFSKIIIWNLGDAFLYTGQYDQAVTEYQKVIELFSDQRSNFELGKTYAAQGKYEQAVDSYLKSYRFTDEVKPEDIQKLKEAYDKNGWEGFGRAMQEVELNRLKAKQAKDPNGYVRAMNYAAAYAWGKDKDKVIEYLDKAYEDRSADILRLKIDLPFVFMRDDPRFKELVRKVGIPE